MIKKQIIIQNTLQKKQQSHPAFELTFYRASPPGQNSSSSHLSHPQTSRRGSHLICSEERPRFHTEPIHFINLLQEDIQCTRRLSPSPLPLVLPPLEKRSIGVGKEMEGGDWMGRLRAKLQVRRIYEEERAAAEEKMACWKRIQARASVLREIKREKLKLMALYNRQ